MENSKEKVYLISLKDEFDLSKNLSIEMGAPNGNRVNVPLYKLVKYSRVFQEELQANYTIKLIQAKVQELISNNQIQEESVFNFYSLLSGERVEVNNSNYWDLFKLSDLFEVEPLKRSLFKYTEEHSKRIDFIIKFLKEEEKNRTTIEKNGDIFSFEYLSNIEELLSCQINECLKNENFGELPISTIYRILSKSFRNEIESDLLYEFINESIEERHPLFLFLKYSTMSDKKFNELYSNILKSSDSKSKHYYEYLSADIEYIQLLKKENEHLLKENQRKDEENEKIQRKQDKIWKENEEQKKQIRRLLENQQQNEQKIAELKYQNDENKNQIEEMSEFLKQNEQNQNIFNTKEILGILIKNKETIETKLQSGEILQYGCEIQNTEFVKLILLSNDIDINSKSISIQNQIF